MQRAVTGIIWVGPVYDRGGYGNVSRNFLLGLARLGFPVRVIPTGDKHAEIDPKTQKLIEDMESTDVGKLPVAVVHGTPELFAQVRMFNVVKRIGCTIFETDTIPPHWAELCNQMDEVWVPSHFNFDTFVKGGVLPAKLKIVPYAVDTEMFAPPAKLPQRAAKQPFTFLYVFSFGWRKGFDLLLEAFLKEFKPGEARLVLRSFTEGYQGVTTAQLRDTLFDSIKDRVNLAKTDVSGVEINDRALSVPDLIKLYLGCDVYITTDRANGWGMPCMEAMALGIPTATIDWSGSTEFMKAHNSVLIHPTKQLEPVDRRLSDAVPALYRGQKWAKVEVGEVRRAMRWAYEHPRELKKIARQGQLSMIQEYNPEAIGRIILDCVTAIKPTSAQALAAAAGVRRPVVLLGSIKSAAKQKVLRKLGRL